MTNQLWKSKLALRDPSLERSHSRNYFMPQNCSSTVDRLFAPYGTTSAIVADIRRRPMLSIRWKPHCRRRFSAKALTPTKLFFHAAFNVEEIGDGTRIPNPEFDPNEASQKIPGFGAGPKEHCWHSVETTEIANLQFLRFSYCQELRPSLTPT